MKESRSGICRGGITAISLALVLGGCGGGNSTTTPTKVAGNGSTYSVGGTVAGLSGSLTLQDDGGDALVVSSNGSFTFATALATGARFLVTVSAQPPGQTCTVSGGSGTIASSNETGIAVGCSTTSTSNPSADLLAFAATVAAIETGANLPLLLDVAEQQLPCSSGNVAITASPFDARFSDCMTTLAPKVAFSGSLASAFVGVVASTLTSVSVADGGLLGATATFPTANVFATASLQAGVLHATLTAQSLAFTIGQSSAYQLATFTIGSPQAMTRTAENGSVTVSIPSLAGTVGLAGHSYTVTLLTPLGWGDDGMPTAGSLQIRDGSSLLLTATFQSDGSVQLVDSLTGLSAAKHWSDLDLAAALKQVTQ